MINSKFRHLSSAVRTAWLASSSKAHGRYTHKLRLQEQAIIAEFPGVLKVHTPPYLLTTHLCLRSEASVEFRLSLNCIETRLFRFLIIKDIHGHLF